MGLEDVPRLKDAPEGRFVVVFFFLFSVAVVVVLNGGGGAEGHSWLSLFCSGEKKLVKIRDVSKNTTIKQRVHAGGALLKNGYLY